ncbi:MAG TPA: GNAT family N-acetyltransferase, partial [Opitutaceae bacterium]
MSSSPSPGGSAPVPVEVRNNLSESRFEALVDGHLSVVDYARQGDTLVLPHTFVPPALRGRGIAEKLVRTALDYARTEKLKVVPSCSYVALYIERHPDFKSLLSA